MNIAKIQVSGVQVVAADAMTRIPAGIVGATVQMEYTGDIWAGLNKAVIFRGNTTREVLTNENTVTVPAEVLAEPRGRLRVGVYGTDAANNVIMPTMWAEVGVIADAAAPAEPADSSLPVWAQLWAMIGNLSNLDTNAKSSLVSAINEILAKTEGLPDHLVVDLDLETMTASHSSAEINAAYLSGIPFVLIADGLVMDVESISADSVKFYHNAILPTDIARFAYELDAIKRITQTAYELAKTVPHYSISDSGKFLQVANGQAMWVRNPSLPGYVKSVNGNAPDENGNVDIEAPSVEDVLAALPTVTNVTVTDHGDGRFTQVKEFSDGSEEVTEVTVDENGIPVKLTVNGVEIPYFFRYGGDDPGIPDEPEIPDDPVIPEEPAEKLVGYKYGDSDVLPDIESVWDKEAYPYALITYANMFDGFYILHCSQTAPSCDMKKIYWSGRYKSYTIGGLDTSWQLSSDKESGINEAYIGLEEPVWTNTDILNDEGSVYLKASEPIPVYE